MAIWTTTSIEETPEIILDQWSVRELFDGDRHFVGVNLTEHREGRVSSKIMEFDPQTMCGRTRSGRIYKLVGYPGNNSDAEYVWNAWVGINIIMNNDDGTNYKDVSEEISKVNS